MWGADSILGWWRELRVQMPGAWGVKPAVKTGTHELSFLTQLFHIVQANHPADAKPPILEIYFQYIWNILFNIFAWE